MWRWRTCIQCECHVKNGGGEALPTETPHFTRKELQSGARLACQVKVKQDMDITIPEEVFGIKKWEATLLVTIMLHLLSRNLLSKSPKI